MCVLIEDENYPFLVFLAMFFKKRKFFVFKENFNFFGNIFLSYFYAKKNYHFDEFSIFTFATKICQLLLPLNFTTLKSKLLKLRGFPKALNFQKMSVKKIVFNKNCHTKRPQSVVSPKAWKILRFSALARHFCALSRNFLSVYVFFFCCCWLFGAVNIENNKVFFENKKGREKLSFLWLKNQRRFCLCFFYRKRIV